ncbi:MAG: imidazolonepropionase [Gemmatimonadales bacterium]
MPLLTDIGCLATCSSATPADAALIPDAALAWSGGKVTWAGPERELPASLRDQETISAGGRLVIPGLIDSHTHLAFGGWRAAEFEQRMRGATYLEIAAAGGGIASTVAATRAASTDHLVERCRGFLGEMARLGVTAVECKSGYGLDPDAELRLLGIYRDLAPDAPVRLIPTFLGAHVVPPEFRGRRDEYVRLVVEEMIPVVGREGLARFCDVFVEDSAFTVDEARRILLAGRAAGLLPKLHADQLTDGGGAALAAEIGATSADHLEHTSSDGIRALADAGVTAVSLPVATLYLGQRPLAARQLLEAGVPVAVASDFNPGSAPSYHLPLAMTLACVLQGMTPAEALMGATSAAARASGLRDIAGSLEAGKSADFAVMDAADVNQWLYHFQPNACVLTVSRGRVTWDAGAAAGGG